MGAGSAVAQSSAEAKYVGRPLTDVLREMQASGVKLVYSTELVRPDLRVVAEPRARAPRKRIDELLKPHGLETRDGPNGTILVVTRARTPKAAKPPAAAPGAGSIGGRVLDATTAAPLAGVVVEVQTTGHSVRTDDDGRFVLAGIPAGRHPLFVSTIGYGLARPVVDVRAGARTELDVPLAEGTGAYTERVTVTADPLAVPTAGAPAQETLGSAALQGVRAVLIDDPLRAVQSLPGVAANDDMRSDFSVRGSDFRHVGTSIDGVATPWLLHDFQENSDSGSLSVLNSDILDRVTLSLGAYPQRYSDRTGAWLESTMREGSRAATAFRAAVSGTNASVLAEGPIGAEAGGSWLVSFRRSYLDWLIRRIVPDFGSSLFAFTDLQSKVVYDLTPRHQLQMIAIAGAARLDQPDERDISSTAHAADDMALGTVALRSTLGSSWLVTQRVALVGQRFRNDNPSGTVNDNGRVLDLSYRADLAWTPRADTTVEAGAQYQRQDESRMSQHYSFDPNRGSVLASNETFEASGHVPAAFAHVVFAPARRFSVSPGVRVAHSTMTDETAVSPWLQASWSLSDSVAVRAGAGVYHQFPAFTQAFGAHAGHDLRSEQARQYDLSIEHKITPSTRWQATLYRRDDEWGLRLADSEFRVVNGRLVVPSSDGPWENALTGRATGVDLLVQRSSPRGLSGWASYSFGHARQHDELTGEHFDADFDQRHTVNVWGQYAISSRTSMSGKLRIGSNYPLRGYWEQREFGLLYVGERRNEVRLPLYARLDVRANRVFNYQKRRLTLFVEVMNVLNRENVRAVSPSSINGRTRLVGGYLQSLFPLMPSAGVLFEF